MNEKRPLVGLGVIVEKDGKILIGKRMTSHGAGTYMIPGGHLEFGETFEEGAAREVLEEAGIKIKNLTPICLRNDIEYEKHYVVVGMHAEWEEGEPRDEEGISESWEWLDPHQLPEPMFPPTKRNIESWLNQKFYTP